MYGLNSSSLALLILHLSAVGATALMIVYFLLEQHTARNPTRPPIAAILVAIIGGGASGAIAPGSMFNHIAVTVLTGAAMFTLLTVLGVLIANRLSFFTGLVDDIRTVLSIFQSQETSQYDDY